MFFYLDNQPLNSICKLVGSNTERMNGTFHALEQINSHQMYQALFTIYLLEYTFTCTHGFIVSAGIFFLFVIANEF